MSTIDLRAGAVADQRGLAVDVALLELDGLLRELDQPARATARLVFRLAKSVRTLASLASRLRAPRCGTARGSIANSTSPALTRWPSRTTTRADLAGNVRRDQHLLRADIGVVGRDVAAAAADRATGADRSRDQRDDDEQDQAQARRARSFGAGAACRSLGASASVTILRAGSAISFSCLRSAWCVLRSPRRRFSFTAAEMREHRVDRGRRRCRRAPSPSSPRRARRAGPSAAARPGVRNSRLARRSLGSARRSIRPLSHSRSISRVRVIGWRSRNSASSDCFRPSKRSSRQHRPLGAGHAETARLLVRIGPQQAAYIVDRKGEFPIFAADGA